MKSQTFNLDQVHRPSKRLSDLIQRFESFSARSNVFLSISDGNSSNANSLSKPKRMQHQYAPISSKSSTQPHFDKSLKLHSKPITLESQLTSGHRSSCKDTTEVLSTDWLANPRPAALALNNSISDSIAFGSSSTCNHSSLSPTVNSIGSSCQSNRLVTISILLPSQVRPISYSSNTQRMLRLLAGNAWFFSKSNTSRCVMLRTLEKDVFFPIIHFKRHNQRNQSFLHQNQQFVDANLFAPNHNLEQRLYTELFVIRFPNIHESKSTYHTQTACLELNGDHESTTSDSCSDQQSLESLCIATACDSSCCVSNRPCSVFSEHSEDSGFLSMNSTSSTNHTGSFDSSSNSDDCLQTNSLSTEQTTSTVVDQSPSSSSSSSSLPSSTNCESITNNSTTTPPELFSDSIRFLEKLRKHTKLIEPRQRLYVPVNKYLLKSTSKLLLDAFPFESNSSARRMRCHLIVGLPSQSDLFTRTLIDNWIEMSGARYIAAHTASRFGLRKICFLKRQPLPQSDLSLTQFHLPLFSHLDCSFDHVLCALYTNVTERSAVLLNDFVYRFRLQYPSMLATLYTLYET